MHTVIIGAGWAGLAAAVELSRGGQSRVTLVEAARQAGGRARSVSFGDSQVDNGQHLLIGAYHQTLQLLESIGIDEAAVFTRRPLQLLVRNATTATTHHTAVHMRTARLPAPLHMLWALAGAGGLSWSERWRALRLCAALPGFKPGANADDDISVSDLLRHYRQPPRLITEVWEPLCLATMNTPVQSASAAVFVRVLIDAFIHHRRDSDLLIPRHDLGAVIPAPAINTLRKLGGEVILGCKVKALDIDGRHIGAAVLGDDSRIEADQFIIATPPQASQRLFDAQPLFADTRQQLSQFDSAPICTVYLQYPVTVSAELPMVGLTGSVGQWLFDRRECGQPGLMAVVISGRGAHEQLNNEALGQQIISELALFYPHWPAPLRTFVIREKRATFVCHRGINAQRPGHRTAADNGWLAGDYTDTGYPATLEGAVRSGYRCAELVKTVLSAEC